VKIGGARLNLFLSFIEPFDLIYKIARITLFWIGELGYRDNGGEHDQHNKKRE
jgi:hypothetical protein